MQSFQLRTAIFSVHMYFASVIRTGVFFVSMLITCRKKFILVFSYHCARMRKQKDRAHLKVEDE